VPVIGLLAHVDAGKTTLSESLLYKTGKIKSLGRVDHKDAYLDTQRLEKDRGITIFSKQATFEIKGRRFYLQDTPGHVDFSAEMERTLCVLDYAVLILSAPDGIQAHTGTILELLDKYNVPTLIFINKIDLEHNDFKLPSQSVDFTNLNMEDLALCDELAMEEYENTGFVSDRTIQSLISERKLFPTFSGSALKLDGIDEFIEGLSRYTTDKPYPNDFSARCFKITRDDQGNRLSWIKICGGSIKPREMINEEKIVQIREYSGSSYNQVDCAESGGIYAFLGLNNTYAGQGIGNLFDRNDSLLEPVLTYEINILDGTDTTVALKKLSILAEEDPLLNISWNEKLSQIQVKLMGEIQIQVLSKVIEDRFGIKCSLDEGSIVYKETITGPVEGVGHFEPLRHYAETHVLMEPLPRGAGLIFDTACSLDVLDKNWQSQILNVLASYEHLGVLTGSSLTDVKITLIAGKSHLKHTEGGDFRQASLRAVRQGLMKANNMLLEPYYSYRLEIPKDQIGRAVNDIKSMGGDFEDPEDLGEMTRLIGSAPVASMQNYQTQVLSYTKGKGKLYYRYKGFYPCHNTDEVIESFNYDPDRDIDNPSSSVFCSHGAGVNVKWDLVEDVMHVQSGLCIEEDRVVLNEPKVKTQLDFDEKVLEDIMNKEFGPIKRPKYTTTVYEPKESKKLKLSESKKQYYIIDGYNMIFAWQELKKLSETSIDAARESLIDILSNFKGIKGCEMVIVFDGYKLKGNDGTKYNQNGINIVYTKEAQSADAYIESLITELGHTYSIIVATSDNLIQLSALRQGTRRMSATELGEEIAISKQIVEEIIRKNTKNTQKIDEIAKIKGDY